MSTIVRSNTFLRKRRDLAVYLRDAIAQWEADHPGDTVRRVTMTLDPEETLDPAYTVQAEIEHDETIVPTAEEAPEAIMLRRAPAWTGPVCRGSIALGTACGRCEKCLWLKREHQRGLTDG